MEQQPTEAGEGEWEELPKLRPQEAGRAAGQSAGAGGPVFLATRLSW